MTDEQRWKQRFLIFAVVRLSGLAVMLLGMGIALTDLVRPGGWPLVGGIVAIMGVADAVLAPLLLRRHWKQLDEAGE